MAQVRELCLAGLSPCELMPALLEALHEVLGSSRNLFDWTDTAGRLLRYDIEGPVDPQIARLYFERFHNRQEVECMPAFASIRHAPAGVRGALELKTEAFFNSALYHEVWKPQHFHSRIEGVVRGSAGQLLGSLVLYRSAKDSDFDSEDEQALATLLPWVARGLESTKISRDDEHFLPSPERTETLLVGPDAELRHATAGAFRLLLQMDCGLTPVTVSRPSDTWSCLLRKLFGSALEELRAGGGGRAMTLINAAGCFLVEFSRLHPWAVGDGLVQIQVRRLEAHEVALHRVLREQGLSAAQIRVCAATYAGRTSVELAQELGVAISTVVDHLRKAYRALNVRDGAGMRRDVDRRVAQLNLCGVSSRWASLCAPNP